MSTPTKRPFLPVTMPKSNNKYQDRCSSSLNQVFVITCVASLFLQLLGSIASWQSPPTLSLGDSRSLVVEDGDVSSIHRRILAATNPSASSPTLTTKASSDTSPLHEDVMSQHPFLGTPRHSGRLRVLVGILSADFPNDQTYRKRHRLLFQLWNDPRVCSLPDFKSRPMNLRYQCQLIYTFVMGGNPNAPPELVDDSRPMEVNKPIQGQSPDVNEPDVILLNIKENMNEGKSQTWMKYGAQIAEEYGLDYVTKCDADSLLHLHEFFEFAYKRLPPAPYNTNIYIGALRDKAYWPRHTTAEERVRFESYFGTNFEGVHLYVAGQIYILSTDLAKFVGEEALANKCSYCEGHEDHDISAMAFHSPNPIQMIIIGRHQRFWEHPVKGEPRWRRIWARENARVKGEKFEGRVLNNNSTFEAIMGHSAASSSLSWEQEQFLSQVQEGSMAATTTSNVQ